MYIKLINGNAEPYAVEQIFHDHPQVSFPKKIPDDTLAEYDVYPLQPTPCPQVDYTKNVTESAPVLQDGKWVQTWDITPATPLEVMTRTNDQAEVVRVERDQRLSATDWAVIKSIEMGVPESEAWKTYRQALRDVPQQQGFPWDITWPKQP